MIPFREFLEIYSHGKDSSLNMETILPPRPVQLADFGKMKKFKIHPHKNSSKDENIINLQTHTLPKMIFYITYLIYLYFRCRSCNHCSSTVRCNWSRRTSERMCRWKQLHFRDGRGIASKAIVMMDIPAAMFVRTTSSLCSGRAG